MDDQLANTGKRPRDIYQSMTVANPDSGPRNARQVHNRKAQVRRQQAPHHRANLADEVQLIMSQLQQDRFVRAVYASGDKPPCVIVYDDKQIDDIRRYCCGEDPRCILGIDRTFNLGKCFVTVTTYKYVDADRTTTAAPPIFLGPCYLHWDASAATYSYFLHHIRMKLASSVDTGICTPADVNAGSDDEKALRSALEIMFPESVHLLCVQHLKRNVEQRLRDKVGCTAAVRRQVVHDIFNELMHCKTEPDFDEKANALLAKFRYVIHAIKAVYSNYGCKHSTYYSQQKIWLQVIRNILKVILLST